MLSRDIYNLGILWGKNNHSFELLTTLFVWLNCY